jgi:hypothetical protein
MDNKGGFTGGLVRKSMITRMNHMTKIYVLCLFKF